MVSLVLNKLDFGNAVLVGLTAYLTRRLQSVSVIFVNENENEKIENENAKTAKIVTQRKC